MPYSLSPTLVGFIFTLYLTGTFSSTMMGRLASHDKAQASSLYLFFYYLGSSIAGTEGGSFWSNYGWSGVVGMIICFIILALILSTRLSSNKKSSCC